MIKEVARLGGVANAAIQKKKNPDYFIELGKKGAESRKQVLNQLKKVLKRVVEFDETEIVDNLFSPNEWEEIKTLYYNLKLKGLS